MRKIRVFETGEELLAPDVPFHVNINVHVQIDGIAFPIGEAVGVALALRDYWRARAIRFETDLADERAKKAEA